MSRIGHEMLDQTVFSIWMTPRTNIANYNMRRPHSSLRCMIAAAMPAQFTAADDELRNRAPLDRPLLHPRHFGLQRPRL